MAKPVRYSAKPVPVFKTTLTCIVSLKNEIYTQPSRLGEQVNIYQTIELHNGTFFPNQGHHLRIMEKLEKKLSRNELSCRSSFKILPFLLIFSFV